MGCVGRLQAPRCPARRSAAVPASRRSCHKRKWGPALLPVPTAPSKGYAGVRNLGSAEPKLLGPRFRSLRTRSGVASETAIPIPWTCIPGRARCPFTALLGAITLASCFVSIFPKENQDRIALETNASSGASYRLTTGSLPKELPNCLPAGDRCFCPFLLAGLPLVGD